MMLVAVGSTNSTFRLAQTGQVDFELHTQACARIDVRVASLRCYGEKILDTDHPHPPPPHLHIMFIRFSREALGWWNLKEGAGGLGICKLVQF